MKVNQVYDIVNSLTTQVLGKSDLVSTDLSNVVEVGKEIFDNTSVDNYVKKLIDHIGKVVFVNRPYTGRAPSILMETWEYGSVLEKIDMGIPDAETNPAWALVNGQTYDQDTFKAPTDITVKFYNDEVTFQVFLSFPEDQVKSAFSNATQLNAFYSMIYTMIETSFTLKLDSLVMMCIDNYIGGLLANEYSTGEYSSSSGIRCINLLYEYNQQFGKSLTASAAVLDLDFIKYASYRIRLTSDHMTNASAMFNIGGRVRHTPRDMQHIILLDSFSAAADIYLQSDTFHNELVKLPSAETVSYWQGTGSKWNFVDSSTIKITAHISDNETASIDITGVIGCIFDREACGVNHYDRRVRTHYNNPGEFINNWYKMNARYFNDFNENGVVFFVA